MDDEASLLAVSQSVVQQLSSPKYKLFLCYYCPFKTELESVLQDITNSQYSAKQREHLVKDWFSRCTEVLYDVDDLFDAVAAKALLKEAMPGNAFMREVFIFFSKSNQLGFNLMTARDSKVIRERLVGLRKDMRAFKFIHQQIKESCVIPLNRAETHSFSNVKNVIGRDREKEEIISFLLSNANIGDKTMQQNFSVISISGIGGLGKTVLAKSVYNDERVQMGFDLCLWAHMIYFSDLKSILVELLKSILKSKPQDQGLDQLQEKFRENIGGKKFLLVLDDVLEENASNWRMLASLLNCGKNGSKVIAITRETKVVQCLESLDFMKKSYHLEVLSETSAWYLLKQTAFMDGNEVRSDPELELLAQQIVQRCRGVPLAVVTLGALLLLRSQKEKKLWLYSLDKKLQEDISDNNVDETMNVLMNVLMASYNDLPVALKCCFFYCSLFPKDYTFDKDSLVRMWAAQGFLPPHFNSSLEEVGDECFFSMVERCFFQEVEMYTWNGCLGYTCKMHNMLHDLALQVARMEFKCLSAEDFEDMAGVGTLRHISVNCNSNFLPVHSGLSSQSKTLRTLLFHKGTQFSKQLLDSSLSCGVLRTLQLSSLNVGQLPNSIGQLIHLKYLDLSYNPLLEILPSSICKLYHLQTLIVIGCEGLKKLPSDLGRLVSLRHLLSDNCTSLTSLPSGLASLTSLFTLDRLIVHHHTGGLKYLERLDNMCGAVKIELPMEGWSNAKEDARKSSMLMKNKLNGMSISWIRSDPSSAEEMPREEAREVLKALQPHDNLRYLNIAGYVGETLPGWVFSLSRVVELILYNCTFEYLDDKAISDYFFRSLKVLKFDFLPRLKGWWSELALERPCVPYISEVVITDCTKLTEEMPLFLGTEKLELSKVNEELVKKLLIGNTENSASSSSAFSSKCQYNSRLEELKLVEIEDLSSLPVSWIRHLTALKKLRITNCSRLSWVSHGGLAHFTALEELEILGCGNVVLVDEDNAKEEFGFGMPWKMLRNLRYLVVPWQRHLIEGLQYLTALETLKIDYWENNQVEVENIGELSYI